MTKETGSVLVDFGNVIIAHWLTDITPENFNTIEYNLIPEVPDAFKSLKRLNEQYEGRLLVIYNATNVAEEKIRKWLLYHEFVTCTGIPLNKVVRSKTGRNKAGHIQSVQGVDYPSVVIDDRLEVLNHFIGKVSRLFLFRPQAEEVKLFNCAGTLSCVRVVWTWSEIIESLHTS